jgi:hypothetical protein
MKQETLEGAAERILYDNTGMLTENHPSITESMIDLAKWQAERMYSKEAVEEMFATLKRNSVDNIATIHNIDLFIESWTREFKKIEQ